LINNQWIIEKIKAEIKKLLEFNENANTTYQNLWDTEKAAQKGKFVAMNEYIKNTKSSQINYLKVHLKLLEKTRTS
jgi:hypothetical protein